MEGLVGLGEWLHTEINVRYRELNPDVVTRLGTNRVRRRLTSMIETDALRTCQAATSVTGHVYVYVS